MIIGNDPYRFEVIHDFCKLPDNIKLGYTHGICVDNDNHIYLFNQSISAVMIMDRHGVFRRSWGEEFQHGAHGMRLVDEEHHLFLYLTDHEMHKVVKTRLRGEKQYTLEVPPRPDLYAAASEFKPTDVCVAPTGDVYIADGYGKPYVHRYNRYGKYLQSIGGLGSETGQFNCPHGVWIDTRKPVAELYVADRGNSRIQVFTLDGKYKRTISDPAIKKPCGFYQFFNELWIADLEARVVVLDKHDKVAAVLGDNPSAPTTPGWPNIPDQFQPGKFNSPHALCVDTYGDVYVCEWTSGGRVTKLVRQSELPPEAQPKPGRID